MAEELDDVLMVSSSFKDSEFILVRLKGLRSQCNCFDSYFAPRRITFAFHNEQSTEEM